MRSLLGVLVAAGVASVAHAHPPSYGPAPMQRGATTFRDFYIPQPDAVVTEWVPVQRSVPQPPRRIREFTTTWTEEIREAQFSAPSFPVQSYPVQSFAREPIYSAPAFYPERRGSFGLGLQLGGRRGLRAGLFFD